MDERNPQLDVIETLDRPVIVQAGAGSGKTYTLTERIINALKPDEDGHVALRSIENVVAITFTRKAAEELKSRIRARLEEENMHDQALLVDDACISTIHGFATRILRENALTFGIDPNFEVIDEAKALTIRTKALERAISDLFSGKDVVKDIIDGVNLIGAGQSPFGPAPELIAGEDEHGFQQVDAEADIHSEFNEMLKGELNNAVADFVQSQTSYYYSEYLKENFFVDGNFSKEKLFEIVDAFTNKIANVPFFNDEFFFGDAMSVQQIMLKTAQLVHNVLTRIDFDDDNKNDQKVKTAFSEVDEELQEFLEFEFDPDYHDEYFEDAAEIFSHIKPFTKAFHKNKSDRELVLSFNVDLANLAIELLCSLEEDNLKILASIADAMQNALVKIKRATFFTNDDLLRICYEMLLGRGEIVARYREKFDLIMIDEFQDTDDLQLKLITLLAKEHRANVCTVGDIQQSIYRFRGADVNVFRDYKDEMVGDPRFNTRVVDLPNNYRSHKDILAFSDKIFAGEDMFGDEFLHLEAKSVVNDAPDPIFENRPRVEFRFDNYSSRVKNDKISTEEVVRYQAKVAADYLKDLVDAGEKPGSMAILLGRLGSGYSTPMPLEIAKIYQEALANVDIESIITGGSNFSRSKEVANVSALLSLGRNVFDSDALLKILRCDFFNFSDDGLLVLTNYWKNNEHLSRQTLSDGLVNPDSKLLESLSDYDKQELRFAQDVIFNFVDEVRYGSIEFALRSFLSACGVFDELDKQGANGLVSAGNYEKCFTLLRNIQIEETSSISVVAKRFVELLENTKESPGVLSTATSDYVEIMTVHNSKGLQFDHVVCAELRDGTTNERDLYIENHDFSDFMPKIFASKLATNTNISKSLYLKDNELFYQQKEIIHEGMTSGELYRWLMKRDKKEELDEAKRLLYVAVTRAKRSMLVMVKLNKKAEDGYEGTGIWEGVYNALKWDYDCTSSTQFVDVDGSKIKVVFEQLPQALKDLKDAAEVSEDVENEAFEQVSQTALGESCATKHYALRPKHKYPETMPYAHEFNDFISYSLLAKFDEKQRQFIGRTIRSIEDNDDMRGNENAFWNIDEDRATEFGTLMHSALELMVNTGNFEINTPIPRLEKALNRILGYKEMFKKGQAEFPFCVKIGESYLRGALDLVRFEGNEAFVVDYKSGTAPKDHELQAQVYAYALLSGGCKKVTVDFLHGEIDLVQHFEFDKAVELEDTIGELLKRQQEERELEERKKPPKGPNWAR